MGSGCPVQLWLQKTSTVFSRLSSETETAVLHVAARHRRKAANTPQNVSLCCLSLLEAFRVTRREFDSSRKLSNDVCVAHQLGEHVAVLHDIRTKQIPLW